MSKSAGLTMGHPMQSMEPRNTSHQPEQYKYEANWPIYAMDWCNADNQRDGFRLALGSFIEEIDDKKNKLQIVTRSEPYGLDYHGKSHPDFTALAEVDLKYPITKVLWEPHKTRENIDLLVTSSDILRVWTLSNGGEYTNYDGHIGSQRSYVNFTLENELTSSNSNFSGFCNPITSFDWAGDQIVASSIDTTCTVWDLHTGKLVCKLIAHDRDMYDVTFRPTEPNMFASVGADGSIRMFDLRDLEYSTILYNAPSPRNNTFGAAISDESQPLLRLQFNPFDDRQLATLSMDSNRVQIFDIRYPSKPMANEPISNKRISSKRIADLKHESGHQSNVNCFQWSPRTNGQLCTGGDDSMVLVWDMYPQRTSNGHPRRSAETSELTPQPILTRPGPPVDPWNKNLSYNTEISSLSWNRSEFYNTWIAVGYGRTVEILSVENP